MLPTSDFKHDRNYRQILGIRFFCGTPGQLLQLTHDGGLIVVPAAPALADLPVDADYREALEKSDCAITDSGFLVVLWLLFRGEYLTRISGLRFLRSLLEDAAFRESKATFWIMPSKEDTRANLDWLAGNGVSVDREACYDAPSYPRGPLQDENLLSLLEARRPRFIVINIGGGVQERLGHYLKTHLTYRPAIICTGAAIAFLSGRQAKIPVWADRMMLGWLLRSISDPTKFLPRYWKGLHLVPLLWKHGSHRVASS